MNRTIGVGTAARQVGNPGREVEQRLEDRRAERQEVGGIAIQANKGVGEGEQGHVRERLNEAHRVVVLDGGRSGDQNAVSGKLIEEPPPPRRPGPTDHRLGERDGQTGEIGDRRTEQRMGSEDVNPRREHVGQDGERLGLGRAEVDDQTARLDPASVRLDRLDKPGAALEPERQNDDVGPRNQLRSVARLARDDQRPPVSIQRPPFQQLAERPHTGRQKIRVWSNDVVWR